jgi:hypothetical protein
MEIFIARDNLMGHSSKSKKAVEEGGEAKSSSH